MRNEHEKGTKRSEHEKEGRGAREQKKETETEKEDGERLEKKPREKGRKRSMKKDI